MKNVGCKVFSIADNNEEVEKFLNSYFNKYPNVEILEFLVVKYFLIVIYQK